MFGSFDRMTLSLINAADTDGKLIPFSLKLPIAGDVSFPSELASVDVFEYQEGFISGGEIVFTIYVGEKSTIDKIADIKDGIRMQLRDEIEIPSIDSNVCYQVINGRRKIYAVVEDNDVVVKDQDELKRAIGLLSSRYSEFSATADKIKQFSKTINK